MRAGRHLVFCHFSGVHANNHVVNVCDWKYVTINIPVFINKREDKSLCILMDGSWEANSLENCLVCALVETAVLWAKTTPCLSACIEWACGEELQNSFWVLEAVKREAELIWCIFAHEIQFYHLCLCLETEHVFRNRSYVSVALQKFQFEVRSLERS